MLEAVLFDVLMAAGFAALLAPAVVAVARLMKVHVAYVLVAPLLLAVSVFVQLIPGALIAGLVSRGHSYGFLYCVLALSILLESLLYTTVAATAHGSGDVTSDVTSDGVRAVCAAAYTPAQGPTDTAVR